MLTDTDKAYMAGLLDGEGHITIATLPTHRGGVRHTLDVRVTNTDINTLHLLASRWTGAAGSVIRRRMQNNERGWKVAGDLRWNTDRAVQLLRMVQPYLLIKARQASIALAFAETIRPRETRTRPITEEEFAYREQLRQEMRALNLRGGGVMPPTLSLEKPVLKCQYCGTEFGSYQKLRKYCSRDCNMKAWRDAYMQRHTSEQVCLICGDKYLARTGQKYCSQKCHGKDRRKSTTE